MRDRSYKGQSSSATWGATLSSAATWSDSFCYTLGMPDPYKQVIDHLVDHESCRLTDEELALVLGVSERTVQRAVSRAKEGGVIHVTKTRSSFHGTLRVIRPAVQRLPVEARERLLDRAAESLYREGLRVIAAARTAEAWVSALPVSEILEHLRHGTADEAFGFLLADHPVGSANTPNEQVVH